MRNDDIDWLNASSDDGLISLCNELAALARPLDAIARRAPSSRGVTERRARRTRIAASASSARA